ncbi:ankyrin repeat-containing domain protein [Dendryphion nanum]|uniref:Ankyrin repeat-containing domain protein n=1 Tax=Dendryphion nanum TaxID=256645 RepID=A0A9P9E718_9PLEO|nr:ankyrin repeat-containing domain protein [Dendryphion nanum]
MAHPTLTAALDEFQQLLSSDQVAHLASFSSNVPTADDVVQLTEQVAQANAGRKSRQLADRIQGLLGSVQQYSTIIDTCVGPNQIAALVWGSIKIVLLVSSNFAEYFEKLSQRINQLGTYCPRLTEYEKLFPASPRLQQTISAFYAIVVRFCSKALEVVQEKGVKRYSKSVWKSFKVEFKDIEESISEAKHDFAEELQLASEQEAHRFRRLMTADIEENRVFRMNQVAEIQENKGFRSEQTLALLQSKARQIQKILKETERQKIRLLRHIPSHDYMTSLRRAQSLRCEDTCSWLINRPEFIDWVDQKGSKHLWSYGIPGCGKSVLLGYIVDHLRAKFSARSDTAVIFYYFDSSEKGSLKVSAFLRCILHQMIRLEDLLPDLQRRLEALFVDRIDQSEPTTSELEELFTHFNGGYKNLFILIDGLDEVGEVEQRNVKSFLKDLQKIPSVQVVATTHAAMNMSKVFISSLALPIRPEDVKDDIETFVQSQIDKYAQDELSVCEPFELDLIKQKLVSDADGMFLWADLQLKVIRDVCEEDGSPYRIPDLLEALPRKITDLYSFLLRRLSDEQAERAKRAFQWAIYSKRALTLGELEDALSIFTGQKSWQTPSFKLDTSRLARLCANLVTHDEANKTVSLAHHTVESFLLDCSNRNGAAGFAIEEAEAEQYMADVCLTYLSFTNFHTALIRTSDTTHLHAIDRPVNLLGSIIPEFIRPLASGALRSRRGKRADQQVDIVNILRTEMSVRQPKRTDPTFQMFDYCKSHWYSHNRYITLQDTKRFIRVESFIRRTDLPKEWLPWSFIEDKKSLPYWNMFAWTVRNGHTVIFRVWQNMIIVQESSYWKLLWREEGKMLFTSACESANYELLEIMLGAKRSSDASVRPSISEVTDGLVRSSLLGHDEVVQRLLQEKADVNAAGYNGRTALQAAAGGGHLVVVERLLQEKADVNAAAVGYNGRTALQAAAGGGHLTVVERLLQEKADVNAAAVGYNGRTALQAAAGGGHLTVVERLLQEKGDVNAAAADSCGRTALQAAAEGGHLVVVERLLQEKADVNAAAVGYNGRTALQAAAEGGHLVVVERLLQEKANVNAAAVGYNGRTALQAAAEGGHLVVVKQLLQEKADVNAAAVGYNGRTALQAAAGGGHLTVVERLLQEKADVNAAVVGYNGRTALQAAAEGGHLVVVERLLQEKADVNAAAVGYNGRTALQAAAEGGHLVVVERLLQEKADVNAAAGAGYNGRTALQAAAGGGHLVVVERLLQEKAKVNAAAVGYNGRTALQAAAEGGHLVVVEQLLQEKADVNAAAGAGFNRRTALQAAAEGGHLVVVERLLQEKADVNAAAVGYNGRTALQAAVEGGHLVVVERLLQEKADVNAAAVGYNGRTALQAAAGGGHLVVVERLLQEKGDVNAAAADSCGRTALQAAAEGGHLVVVEQLLQEKADVNAVAADSCGRTVLQAAAGGGHLVVVERLLQEKAKVNAAAVGYNGRTALQAAAEGGHLVVVERLLQEKADVNAVAVDSYGRTALQAAAGGGHLVVVERLLQEKADVNAVAVDSYGRTALQAAAGGGHLVVVERLLQEKANVNAAAGAGYNGRTALQAAAEGGHLVVVERLLQEKADVNAAADDDGRTVLQAAAEGGHLAVVECLRKAGARE